MERTQFEILAEIEDVHWWFRVRREILFDRLRVHVPPGRGKTVAEIGCGTGGNLRFLSAYYRVLGIDSSPEAVRLAATKGTENVFLGDFREALEGRWKELDAVLLADILEHVEDDKALLADVVSPLAPGAVVVITVPAHPFLWSRHDVVLGHRRRYASAALRRLWRPLDVRERFFSAFNCLLFPPIALLRLLMGRSAGRPRDDIYFIKSGPANGILRRLFSLERHWLNAFPLPFGVSYIAVLEKTGRERNGGHAG